MPVANGPGAIALTVMPLGASSIASARVSAVTPPLLAMYGDRSGSPTWPSMLEMLMMRPFPAARIRGSTARQHSHVPLRLVSTTSSHCASVSAASGSRRRGARVVDEDIDRAKRTECAVDHRLDREGVADIQSEAEGLDARCVASSWAAADRCCLIATRDHDASPGGREGARGSRT